MYLDTAILVKLFVPEPDSDFYARMTDRQTIVSSWLAYTETWSALLAKERNGLLDPRHRAQAWAEFERNVEEETIRLVPLTIPIFRKVNRILEACHPHIPLRSLDAIHLACCDHVQEWPLCTNDKRMRQAAEHLNFPLGSLFLART